MKLEELLQKLEPQISYLANSTKVPGMDKKDIAQELRLRIIAAYKKFPLDIYKEGWWFKRLKWEVLNLFNKEKKEPTNRSIRMEKLNGR